MSYSGAIGFVLPFSLYAEGCAVVAGFGGFVGHSQLAADLYNCAGDAYYTMATSHAGMPADLLDITDSNGISKLFQRAARLHARTAELLFRIPDMTELGLTIFKQALNESEQAETIAIANGELAEAKFFRAELVRKQRLFNEQLGRPVTLKDLSDELKVIDKALSHSAKLDDEARANIRAWTIETTKLLAIAHIEEGNFFHAAELFERLSKLYETNQRPYESAVASFQSGLCYEACYEAIGYRDIRILSLMKESYEKAAGIFYSHAYLGEAAESYYKAGVAAELLAVETRTESRLSPTSDISGICALFSSYVWYARHPPLFDEARTFFQLAARLYRENDSPRIAEKILISDGSLPHLGEAGERVPVGIAILGRTPKIPHINHISRAELVAHLKRAVERGVEQRKTFDRFMRENFLSVDERVAIENYLGLRGFQATLTALIGEDGISEVEKSTRRPYGRRKTDRVAGI